MPPTSYLARKGEIFYGLTPFFSVVAKVAVESRIRTNKL